MKKIDIIFKIITILNLVAIIAFAIFFFGPFSKNTLESSASFSINATYQDLRLQCLEGRTSACDEAKEFSKNNFQLSK